MFPSHGLMCCMLGPQLVVLFGEVVETLEGGDLAGRSVSFLAYFEGYTWSPVSSPHSATCPP
jgi:hypothetical protein